MKKETTKKSKLWLLILIAVLLLAAVAGGAIMLLGGNQGDVDDGPAVNVPTGPRADLYWNLDREFYTANSQTGLSTREADAEGKFKMRFAYNGEIVEIEIIDKKLVNIIDTQDVVGLTFDANGVAIAQINVRELATEVGKKVYVKKATDDMIIANSSMAMNGMELNLKVGQYTEVYDLRETSDTFGQKIAPTALQVMDCVTVYANADGDNTHVFLLSSGERSKVYWRADIYSSASNMKAPYAEPDEDGFYTLKFYCEGELLALKTKSEAVASAYVSYGKHSAYTGLKFDENGYIIDTMNVAVGLAGQQTFWGLDIIEIKEDGTLVMKNYWSSSGVMNWEGKIPEGTPIYNVSTWAYSEGKMGQLEQVSDLKVGDRLTMWSDMDGNPIQVLVTQRRVDLKPMFNNSSKYDAVTGTTTRTKGEDGYWTYTFIDEKGIHKYKTKDQKLANFIDSYPERVFGIVTKGDKILKAYEYECIYGQVRFSTALYVDSINGTIISCTDQKKANAYNAVLAEDLKVLDISGDSEQWGAKTKLQVGDCMISFRNSNKEVCMIYVTKRAMGGKLYVNTTPNTSREPIIEKNDATDPEKITASYWLYEMTDINGKKVTLKLNTGKQNKDGVYANKYLQSRIDGAAQGVIALEVSKDVIKDAHTPGNMASGNSVNPVIITKAGSTEFEYKTAAKADAAIYPGWTGDSGVKYINLSGDYKSHKGEKLSGGMKVNDVYYMVRNRANETVAMFLISRGFHNDLFFVKNPMPVVNGQTTRTPDANGYYTFSVMYAGKPATVRTKDVALATSLETKYNGAALKLNKEGENGFRNIILGVSDYKGTNDAYEQLLGNWDVSAVSGKNITLKLNIPTTTTTVGETKKVNIGSAKVYNISPDAGEDFGKITKLQKNDRVRIYTDKKGNVSYVLVTVRNGLKVEECAHCGKKVTWNPITASSGMGTGAAHYYVFTDWNVGGQQSIASQAIDEYEVVIDLNGKTVFNRTNACRTFMAAYPGKTLTLMDSVGTGVVQSYGWDGNGGVIQVTYGATLNILGGTYKLLERTEGMKAPMQGGVVFAYSEAQYGRTTVNIKGGTLIGGSTEWNVADKFSSGTVGAIMADVNMSGGTITGGTADRGGNLTVGKNATFTMTGGEISNGTARNRGGNIFADPYGIVIIDGGKVTGGTSNQQGGNIAGTQIALLSGEISNGTSTAQSGGNIFLLSKFATTVEQDGEQVNVAVGPYLQMTGGKITGGTANYGGNIFVYGSNGSIIVTGGEITGGTARNSAASNNISMDYVDADNMVEMLLAGTAETPVKLDGGINAEAGNKVYILGNVEVNAKDGGLRLGGPILELGEMLEGSKVYVTATGKFATGLQDADISTYANTFVFHADTENGKIECVEENGAKWLTASVVTPEPEPDPEPDPEPETPNFETIIAEANKMTTDNVFASGEVVTAVCPVCGGEAVEWAPLTATMNTLDTGDYRHYYMPGDITRTDGSRFKVGTAGNTVCIHLNGKTYNQGSSSGAQGAIQAIAGTTLNIMGNGTVIGDGLKYNVGTTASPNYWYGGGAIDARGTVNIYGGTYSSSNVDRPAVALFGDVSGKPATINMYGGTITKGAATGTTTEASSNVRMHAATQTFNMYGGTIENGTAVNGGNVRMQGGSFNMYGGTIKNGTSANLGGNICVRGGTFTMTGGTVTGGTTAASGGNFGLVSGTLDVQGGTISNGTAVSGGHVYVYGGTLNVSGGEWSNGTGAGGGILLAASNNTFTGGTFTNNKAGTILRDITVGSGKAATLGGDVDALFYVSGNLNVQNGAKATVTLTGSGVLTLADDLAAGTEILVAYDGSTENAPLTAANPKAAEYANTIVKAADTDYFVQVNAENKLYLASKASLQTALATTLATATEATEAVCPVCLKTETWVPLTATMTTLDDGEHTHYFLAGDVTREDSGRFALETENRTTCIFLNGKTYTQANTGNIEGAIKTGKNTTLNLLDVAANTGTVIGVGKAYDLGSNGSSNWQATGGAIDARGTVNIYGGTYKSNHNQRPAVSLWNENGIVNMYGGKIVKGDNTTATSNALSNNVRIRTTGTFNMYGGEISGGMAKQGGNVYMLNGTFNMYGGTIKNGTAGNLGGNVRIVAGTFTMTGGEILNGTATGTTATGGSIGIAGGKLVISGGTISGGTAAQGGVIGNNGGTVEITGGTISNGIATNNGGNITAMGGNMTITGGTISGGQIGAEGSRTDNDVFVYTGKALTLGKNANIASLMVAGTVTVQNGTVATIQLNATGRVAFASGVTTGTEITVVVPATQTIATVENAADYVAYFKAGVAEATITVAEGTNDIVMTLPAAAAE